MKGGMKGGLEAQKQGELSNCYAHSSTKVLMKLLKKMKIVPDLREYPEYIKNLDVFEIQYVKSNQLYEDFLKKVDSIDFINSSNTKTLNTDKVNKLIQSINTFINIDELSKIIPETQQLSGSDQQELSIGEQQVDRPEIINYDDVKNISISTMKKYISDLSKIIETQNNNNVPNVSSDQIQVPLLNREIRNYQDSIGNYDSIYYLIENIQLAGTVEYIQLAQTVGYIHTFYKNLPQAVLYRRSLYVSNNKPLLDIINEQTKTYYHFLTYITKRCGTDGADSYPIFKGLLSQIYRPDLNISQEDFCETEFNNASIVEDINSIVTKYNIDLNNNDNYVKKILSKIPTSNILKLYEININSNQYVIYTPNTNKEEVTKFVSNKEELFSYIDNCLQTGLYLYAVLELSGIDDLFENGIEEEINNVVNIENTEKVDRHTIVIIGSDDKYITIKNSWAITWGNFGKLRIKKNLFLQMITSITWIEIMKVGGKRKSRHHKKTKKRKTKKNKRISKK